MDCPFFFSFFHLLLPQFVITFHNLYIIFPHIIFIILNEICLYIYVLLKLRVSFLMYSKYEFYVSKYGLSIHNKVILMVTNIKLMWHWFGKSLVTWVVLSISSYHLLFQTFNAYLLPKMTLPLRMDMWMKTKEKHVKVAY